MVSVSAFAGISPCCGHDGLEQTLIHRQAQLSLKIRMCVRAKVQTEKAWLEWRIGRKVRESAGERENIKDRQSCQRLTEKLKRDTDYFVIEKYRMHASSKTKVKVYFSALWREREREREKVGREVKRKRREREREREREGKKVRGREGETKLQRELLWQMRTCPTHRLQECWEHFLKDSNPSYSLRKLILYSLITDLTEGPHQISISDNTKVVRPAGTTLAPLCHVNPTHSHFISRQKSKLIIVSYQGWIHDNHQLHIVVVSSPLRLNKKIQQSTKSLKSRCSLPSSQGT